MRMAPWPPLARSGRTQTSRAAQPEEGYRNDDGQCRATSTDMQARRARLQGGIYNRRGTSGNKCTVPPLSAHTIQSALRGDGKQKGAEKEPVRIGRIEEATVHLVVGVAIEADLRAPAIIAREKRRAGCGKRGDGCCSASGRAPVPRARRTSSERRERARGRHRVRSSSAGKRPAPVARRRAPTHPARRPPPSPRRA